MLSEYAKYNSENENAALYYHMVYRRHSRNAHPELFGDSSWHSSFYKRLSEGEERLKHKGILDKNLNPTDLAYQTLPIETLADMLKKLRKESIKMADKKEESDRKILELETRCRNLQSMERYKMVNEIANEFSLLGVDENWIALLISTNLVEQAIRMKLERLGIQIKAEEGKSPNFKDLIDTLGNALKEKENRALEALIKPKQLYDIRSKIDHAGFKMKVTQEQAQAIFVLVKNIIDDLRL